MNTKKIINILESTLPITVGDDVTLNIPIKSILTTLALEYSQEDLRNLILAGEDDIYAAHDKCIATILSKLSASDKQHLFEECAAHRKPISFAELFYRTYPVIAAEYYGYSIYDLNLYFSSLDGLVNDIITYRQGAAFVISSIIQTFNNNVGADLVQSLLNNNQQGEKDGSSTSNT